MPSRNPTRSTALPTTLAALRITTGLAFIALPAFTLRTFLVPQPTASSGILATRLAGTRELVLGELLWYTIGNWRRGAAAEGGEGGDAKVAGNGNGSEERSALLSGAPVSAEGDADSERERIVAYVLLAGAVVDGLDVLACVLGYVDGSLPGDVAVLVGAAASFACGLGVVALGGGGWRI